MSHVHPLGLSLARGATGGDEGGGGGGCPCEGGGRGQEERRGGEREEKEGEGQSKGRIFSRSPGSLGRPCHLPPLTGSSLTGSSLTGSSLQLGAYHAEKDYQSQLERRETEKRTEVMRAWREEQAKRNKQRLQLIFTSKQIPDMDFSSLFIGWSIVMNCS